MFEIRATVYLEFSTFVFSHDKIEGISQNISIILYPIFYTQILDLPNQLQPLALFIIYQIDNNVQLLQSIPKKKIKIIVVRNSFRLLRYLRE